MADPEVVLDNDSTEVENPSIEVEDSPEEETSVSTAPDETEEEARKHGWVSKGEWKKDPRLWKDAATFVDARNHVLPLVRKENQSLRDQVSEMRAELAKLRELETAREKQREQLSLDTLKVQRRQALEEQNYDAVNELDEKLMQAAAREAVKPQQQQPQVDPAVDRMWNEFLSENRWSDNDEAKQLVIEKMVVMKQAGSNLQGRDLLDKAKDRLRREYPELFPGNRRPMAESGGFNGSTRRSSLSWSDVKPEVREAMEKHILTEKGMTKQGLLEQMAENPSLYFRQ